MTFKTYVIGIPVLISLLLCAVSFVQRIYQGHSLNDFNTIEDLMMFGSFILVYVLGMLWTFKRIEQNKIKKIWRYAIIFQFYLSYSFWILFFLLEPMNRVGFFKSIVYFFQKYERTFHFIFIYATLSAIVIGILGAPLLVWVIRRYQKLQGTT